MPGVSLLPLREYLPISPKISMTGSLTGPHLSEVHILCGR